MTEELDPQQTDFEKVYDALDGKAPAPAKEPVAASVVDSAVSDPEPAAIEQAAPVVTDKPVYFPEKYKTKADEEKAIHTLASYVAGVKAQRDFEARLKDPETREQALKEFLAKYEVQLPVAENKEEEPLALGDIDDDDVVTGKQVKTYLEQTKQEIADLIAKAKGNTDGGDAIALVRPILEERRAKELEGRGGVFALYNEPEIKGYRKEIVKMDAEGKEGLDVMAHYAAIGMAIERGGFTEALTGYVEKSYAEFLERNKEARPETASNAAPKTKRSEQLSPEEAEQKTIDDMFDIVPGR